jgi:hypothetical protein
MGVTLSWEFQTLSAQVRNRLTDFLSGYNSASSRERDGELPFVNSTSRNMKRERGASSTYPVATLSTGWHAGMERRESAELLKKMPLQVLR